MGRASRAGVLAVLLAGKLVAAQTDSPAPPRGDTARQMLLTPVKGDWDEIQRRGVLRALVVYSRTLFFVDRGKQRGATYEALKAFEDDVNKRLKRKALRFHVVFIPVTRDQLIPALLEGRGDIAAANLLITPERSQVVDFTVPVLEDVSELVVTGPSGPKITSVDQLSGQTVHVRQSSSYREHLEALNRRLVEQGKEPVKLVPVPEELEDEDVLEMVNAGLIPATICDEFHATFWKRLYTHLSFDPAVSVISGGAAAWMIRKDSPQLKAVTDSFIRRHRKGTEFGNTLFRRYTQGNPSSVLPATSKREIRKFEQTVELFRKYGQRYDVDYLLVMAQGYQESRLDQRATSHVGAVGVMQLMPATGAQMRVGDIHELEPNIHGGVKYLRHVEDSYFDEPGLDPLVKALFAFASYNAGPNRIQSLRREAARRGLDPNRWFKNVEYVAADRIGQETVTYVSNIFKYYVAYQLVAAAQQDRANARQPLETTKP
jgi:membrane-bound lytic murein transglycosylase MltF